MKKKKAGSSNSVRKQLDRIEEYFKKLESNVSRRPKEEKHKKKIVFAISLKSRIVSRNWDQVQANLSKTLRSILKNTDQNFRIIIAGHEKPDIKEIEHRKVTWLSVDFPPPVPPGSAQVFGEDKRHKRRVIGAYLREIGFSGYFMVLDADDWIHNRFVEYIRSQPITDAFILTKGIMINQGLKEVWVRNHFYRGCGSSALVYFSNKDFPITSKKKEAEKLPFGMTTMHHPRVPQDLKAINKDFKKVDLPFVTYVLGHGDNISVISGNRSNRVSAKTYKAQRIKLNKWFYRYFKINTKYK